MNFKVNCTCRDEPDSPVGNRVLVIRPKDRTADDVARLAEVRVVEESEPSAKARKTAIQ
jgi:hypothetical protein